MSPNGREPLSICLCKSLAFCKNTEVVVSNAGESFGPDCVSRVGRVLLRDGSVLWLPVDDVVGNFVSPENAPQRGRRAPDQDKMDVVVVVGREGV